MGSGNDMQGMDHGSMMGGTGTMQSPLLGGAGDIDYPHYLVNGRVPGSPVTLSAKPGQRVRIRYDNAGSDTAFRVAVGGHRMTSTHSDGYPVGPGPTDALLGRRVPTVSVTAHSAIAEKVMRETLPLVR